MTKKDKLSASLEDYLEAIYLIGQEKDSIRVKDIAERLNVKAPSVTGALRLLTDKKLIKYAPYELVTMTKKGADEAQEIILRHDALTRFFNVILDVNLEDAEKAACEMEHCLPENILEKLIQFVDTCSTCDKI